MAAVNMESGAMNAAERAMHMRAWFKKSRREFRILGLPRLAPVQVAAVLQGAEMPWLRAEAAADQTLEALHAYVHTCAQPDPEAVRLMDEYRRARSEADELREGHASLMRLELDYLRNACWGDAWRDQVPPPVPEWQRPARLPLP